jgi:hypothetical protein
LHASYPKSQLTAILFASNQVCTGLMLLAIWLYAAWRRRFVDTSMERSQIAFMALRTFLTPLIFLLSIAVIFFRTDFAIYFWLLVIVLEAVDLIYRRVRRASYKKGQFQAEADG